MTDNRLLDEMALERLRRIGGNQLLSQMIIAFLENVPKRVESVVNGHGEGDFKTIELAAHSIKSSAGNLGAVALGELADQIEMRAEKKEGDNIPSLILKLEKAFEQVKDRLEEIRRGTGK